MSDSMQENTTSQMAKARETGSYLFPPEILSYIFRFACTDNGITGRSLSSVSWHISEVAKEWKLQSIALYTVDQIIRFTEYLNSKDPNTRNIRNFYVTVDGKLNTSPQSSFNVTEVSHIIAIVALFEVVAPHLHALSIYLPSHFVWLADKFSLLPCIFPELRELSYNGVINDDEFFTNSKVAPRLERLTVTSFGKLKFPQEDLAGWFSRTTPNLTHLCVVCQNLCVRSVDDWGKVWEAVHANQRRGERVQTTSRWIDCYGETLLD